MPPSPEKRRAALRGSGPSENNLEERSTSSDRKLKSQSLYHDHPVTALLVARALRQRTEVLA
jgi:hypothetical protein